MPTKTSKPLREIYLFRHGYSEANLERNRKILFPKLFAYLRLQIGFTATLKLIRFIDKLRGIKSVSIKADSDIPLESLGNEQSKLTGKILAQRKIFPDLILCSDFLRTRQTANGILKGMEAETGKNLSHKILYSKLIVERNGGIEYGYPLSYYPILFPETNKIYQTTHKLDFCPPGGESIRDVRYKRIPGFLDVLKQLNFETLFIVGHGITNSTIVSLLIEKDIEEVQIGSPNLGVYRFTSDENSDKWILDPLFAKGEPIDKSIPASA